MNNFSSSSQLKPEDSIVTEYLPTIDAADRVMGASERPQAQTLLPASEQYYVSIAETLPIGIFRTDASGKGIYHNNRWYQIAGVSAEDARGNDWIQSLHPEDRERVPAEWQKAIREHRPFQLEYRFQRPDSQVTWVYGQAKAELDANGQIIGYAGTLTDISDRKQAEIQLQTLIEGTAATTGKDYFPALASHIAKVLNVSYALVTEKVDDKLSVLAFWANDSLQSTFAYSIANTPCQKALQQGQYYCESFVQEKFPADLDLVEMEAESYFGIALQDTQGKAIGNLCILDQNPIADPQKAENLLRVFAARAAAELERERADQALARLNQELEQRVLERTAALQASEAELRSLFMGMDDVVFVLDRVGTYLKVAPTNPEKLMAPADTLLGKNIQDFFAPEQATQFLGKIEQTLTTQQTQSYEYSVTIDEIEYWFHAKCSPLDDRSAIWVARDITEAKQAEVKLTETNRQLAVSNQELIRATRLKDEFLANMSHELRTPLNAILGLSESFLAEVFGAIDDRQKKAISTVERSGQHLLSLINDILEVSKIEAGKLELEMTTVSATTLTSSTLAFIKQLAHQKQIQLTTSYAPNLGNIEVDERRIRQVLINLLNNAVKFTPAGGQVKLEVQIEQAEFCPLPTSTDLQQQLDSGAWIVFAVTDTGIGIIPENQSKLFKPFVQIDGSLNRHYQGTGLGLTLVKQIVELHGGSVSLASEFGRGSCFTVRLPYQAADQQPTIPSPEPTPSRSITDGYLPSIEYPLILLTEDNQDNIETFSSYLEACNYRLILASNGHEAISILKDRLNTPADLPDLILMDIQMSGMDGLETMQRIRQDPQLADLPVIALTALAMTGDREKCLAAGANDYLTKPIKLKQLQETIQRLIPAS